MSLQPFSENYLILMLKHSCSIVVVCTWYFLATCHFAVFEDQNICTSVDFSKNAIELFLLMHTASSMTLLTILTWQRVYLCTLPKITINATILPSFLHQIQIHGQNVKSKKKFYEPMAVYTTKRLMFSVCYKYGILLVHQITCICPLIKCLQMT